MADDTTVAVLGTGIMGAAMARNLLSAGMEVRAWNRSREKVEPLKRDGAEQDTAKKTWRPSTGPQGQTAADGTRSVGI